MGEIVAVLLFLPSCTSEANPRSSALVHPVVTFITLIHCFTSGVGDSPVTLKADFSLAFSAITFTIF